MLPCGASGSVVVGCMDKTACPTGKQTGRCRDLAAQEISRNVMIGFLILISAGFMASESNKTSRHTKSSLFITVFTSTDARVCVCVPLTQSCAIKRHIHLHTTAKLLAHA